MQVTSIKVLASAGLVLMLSACNVPAIPLTPPVPGTPTPQAMTSPTPLATPGTPQIKVTSPTNCRSGPSTSYDLVFTANPGLSYTIVGAYTGGSYWIIDNPVGGTCWLFGQSAVVTGNTAILPDFPTPPLPQEEQEAAQAPAAPAVPSAPQSLSESSSCTSGFRGGVPVWIEGITLNWNPAAGPTGYQVFKNNVLSATLGARATGFHADVRYDKSASGNGPFTYGVDAFNGVGVSSMLLIEVPRCP